MRKVNSVILAVTNDIFEFPIRVYDTTKEMARDLKISEDHCRSMIYKRTVYHKLNCKFIRVWLDERNFTKGGNDYV